MPYPPQRHRKPENHLMPEEEVVREALSDYTDALDKARQRDFVPTAILYQLYLAYVATHGSETDLGLPLPIRHFGGAVQRIFPELGEIDPETGRCFGRTQRHVNGRVVWGYCGLRGPLSVITQTETGGLTPFDERPASDEE